MAPTPRACPVDECTYTTPAALPNYDLIYKDLGMYLEYCHTNNRPSGSPATSSKPKPDKLPRPEIGEGATEADWVFFLDKWNRYKRSTALDSQSAVDQLWACCSSELGRSVYDSGVANTTSETKLLEAMKKLAVWAQNTLINVVDFLEMTQGHEETVGSFSARLRGQAAVCDFTINCSLSSCGNPTS